MSAGGASAPGRTRALGALFLGLALAASVALSLRHLGARALPGCTLDSPCERALGGPLATLPLLDWPVAFAGASAFAGLLAAWTCARAGWPRSLRWIARLGGLASLGWLVLALVQRTPCPYCLTAQAANLAFVWCSERARGPARARRVELGGVLTFVGVSALLGGLRGRFTQQHAETPVLGGARAFTGRYRLGPERAAARLVLFGDYQCADCARLEGEARALVAARADVSLSVKHFPLCRDCNRQARALGRNPHPNACWAARAAEAAGIVGGAEAFWRMHTWLFARGGAFTDDELRAGLAELSLEVGPFVETLHSAATLARVEADVEEALALGLQSTPTVFLDGVELRALDEPQALQRAVEELLARAPQALGAEADRPPDARAKALADWRLQPRVELAARAGEAPLAPGELAVVVWGDYLDADTRELDRRVRAFRAAHPAVRYSFRHFPLDAECVPSAPDVHRGACRLARRAEAARALAGEPGFERMHAWLCEPAESRLAEGASVAGIDAAALAQAAEAPAAHEAVQADVEAARRAGVQAIPCLFVGGQRVPRWRLEGVELLELVLAEALAER